MEWNLFFYIIIWFLIFDFLVKKLLDYLNSLYWSDNLPEELSEVYDEKEYKKSQDYEKVKSNFSHFSDGFSFILILILLVFWLFWELDIFLRNYIENDILLALAFFAIISFVNTIINIPFSYYSTFVIEQKFGFNKSTKKLFFLDIIKWIILSFIIWWIILSLIVWIYTKLWFDFWYYAWAIITAFSVFFMMFYSSLIVPLFNKQTPLEDWELKDAINDFAAKVWFKLDNIYVIDGSKRSSKANAYFTWIWNKKRIVLFDTLINDLNKDELVAVLAHEIGHYKKKHVYQMLAFSVFQTWFIFFLFALSLWSEQISTAMWADKISFHIWAMAFWLLFAPISMILSIFANILSRKNEYEADSFALENHDGTKLASALKKLSKKNLANLKPHPAYEFVHYSHPWVLKRLNALRVK